MATTILHIAQRGGRGLLPENTLPAFANAIRLGCDGAELDVHLTKDNQVVVHDAAHLNPDYCRRADGDWISREEARSLAELTYEELQQYDIGQPKPASRCAKELPFLQAQEGAKIPRLSDVIAMAQAMSDRFMLVVDLKTPLADALDRPWLPLVEAVLENLQRHDFLRRAVLTSYDWGSLIHAKRLVPQLRTWFATMPSSWLANGNPPAAHSAPSAWYRDLLKPLDASGDAPWYAGFDPRKFDTDVPAAVCAAGGDGWLLHFSDFDHPQAVRAHRAGMPAIVWSETRNDPVGLHRLLAAGPSGFCTDYPDIKPTACAIDVAPVLERAAVAHKDKNWPEAIANYKYVVDHFPRHAPLDAFVKLAVSQRTRKDLDAASATLEACRLAYPNSPAPLIEVALIHMLRADWQKALAIWEKLFSSGVLKAQKANQYNRAARACEVVQRWDLHTRVVDEGLSKFPNDKDLRMRRLYNEAQANVAREHWEQAISAFDSLVIPTAWPFGVSFFKHEAQIERALSVAGTDAERSEVLHSAHLTRTSLPWPYQMAGLSNAIQRGTRTACMDEKLVEALLALVEVIKHVDVDIKRLTSQWVADRVADVARVARPEAVDSLLLPASYYRTICRILLRGGHLQPYWLLREKYVAALDLLRIGEHDAVSYRDLINQVVLANERADHHYFARLRETAARDFAASKPADLMFMQTSRLYHSRPPFEWATAFTAAEQQFAELVSGKSVAIVGPAASDESPGEEIDGFDLVVRFNHRKSLHYDPKKFGRKTNLSWYIHSDLPATPNAAYMGGMDDLDFVVVDRWCWKQCPWLSEVRTPKRGRLECAETQNNPLLFGSPNGIQRVLLDLLRFDVKRVKLFNSNLFLNPQYEGGYRAPPKNLFVSLSLHDPVGNFFFVKRLRELGTIETDALLGDILTMSTKEYVDAMDARYGSGPA